MHSCFLLPHLPACDKIKEIGESSDLNRLGSLLNTLVTDCNTRYHVVGNNEVTFLIHFGNQGHDECVTLTNKMNEAVTGSSTLSRFRFIAVSRHNQCPSIFFVGGDGRGSKLTIPDEDAIRDLLEKWKSGKSEIPKYDHLRSICILCKVLLALPEDERKEKASSSEWWIKGIWGEGSNLSDRGYSEEENNLISRSDDLLVTFCKRILSKSSFPAEYCEQESLEKIVKTINTVLK